MDTGILSAVLTILKVLITIYCFNVAKKYNKNKFVAIVFGLFVSLIAFIYYYVYDSKNKE